MHKRFFSSVVTAFICFILCVNAIAQPIALHPSNPHYFQYKNKPTVLITSGEHYGAVLNLDFNYKTYLDELYSKNLNMTRTFSGVYCEPPGAFNIANNTLAPLPHKYIAPWVRSSTPGYRNDGNKFDLTKWDPEYFKRVKDFIAEAAERDIIVEFTLFCPFYEDTMWIYSPLHRGNNVNNTPDIPRTDVYTIDKSGSLLDIQKKLVRKLVTELNSFDNVIFEICNEPYFGGVTLEWQHAIANEIVETEKDLPKKHLVSQNVANGSSLISNPHPAVSIFNFHYAYPPVTIAYNYHLNKVIGDNETGFRGTSDSTYRFEGWRFIIGGGGLYNNLDYSFTPGYEKGDFIYNSKTPGGGSDSLRKQLSYLRKFIESFNFIKMKPDSTVLTDTSLRCNVLAEQGKQYAVYLIDGRLSSLSLSVPSGKYEAVWMHPATGKYEKARIVTSINGKVALTIPKHKEDIALRLRSR
jgi:hypothetical protein